MSNAFGKMSVPEEASRLDGRDSFIGSSERKQICSLSEANAKLFCIGLFSFQAQDIEKEGLINVRRKESYRSK